MFKLVNHALDQVSLFVNWMTDQERPWSDILNNRTKINIPFPAKLFGINCKLKLVILNAISNIYN